MENLARAGCLVAFALTALTGCAENSMVMKGQLDKSRDEQLALSRQKEELQNRASRMDRDNQDLVNQLTQSKQRVRDARRPVGPSAASSSPRRTRNWLAWATKRRTPNSGCRR